MTHSALAVLALLVTTGCGAPSVVDLQSPSIQVVVGEGVEVTLGSVECAPLRPSARATLNGVRLQQTSEGKLDGSSPFEARCATLPTFVLPRAAMEGGRSQTLRIEDDGGSLEVVMPTLGAPRGFTIVEPADGALRPGGSVRVAWPPELEPEPLVGYFASDGAASSVHTYFGADPSGDGFQLPATFDGAPTGVATEARLHAIRFFHPAATCPRATCEALVYPPTVPVTLLP